MFKFTGITLTIVFVVTMATNSVFLVDTGSSYHVTGDASNLTDLRKISPPVHVNTGNGKVPLEYVGTAYFVPFEGANLPIALEDTLYNPHSDVNLISYGRLTRSCDVSTVDDKFKVYLKETGKHLFTAKKNQAFVYPAGRVYKPNEYTGQQNPQYQAMIATMQSQPVSNATLIHRKLGHISYSTMAQMYKKDLFDGLNVSLEDIESCQKGPKCDACMAGKLTKLPHLPSETKERNRLHVDVCSIEYSVLSNAKAMLVAIHELTDYSFVVLIKTKDESGPATREIVRFIGTQTGQKVTAIRSDNGGEFVNKTIGGWLKEEGIKPELTIPYTPWMGSLHPAAKWKS